MKAEKETLALGFGATLRDWRKARGLSQMKLAGEAGVSTRHLAFLENARALPSRDCVLQLAAALKLPGRETNALLNAAGHLAQFSETPFYAPQLAAVRRATDLFLEKMEPFPTLILNQRWEALAENEAAIRHARLYLPEIDTLVGRNILMLLFSPDGFQPFVEDWPTVSGCLLRRLGNEIGSLGAASKTRQLIDALTAFSTTPGDWRNTFEEESPPVLTLGFKNAQHSTQFFTTLSTFGAAQDLTVQDIRLETYFPADAATKSLLEELARNSTPQPGIMQPV